MVLSDIWEYNEEATVGCVFHQLLLVWFVFLFTMVKEHLTISHSGVYLVLERDLGFLFEIHFVVVVGIEVSG